MQVLIFGELSSLLPMGNGSKDLNAGLCVTEGRFEKQWGGIRSADSPLYRFARHSNHESHRSGRKKREEWYVSGIGPQSAHGEERKVLLPGPAKAFFVLRQYGSPWCNTRGARASVHDLLSNQRAHLSCGKRGGSGRECIRFESVVQPM